MDTASFPAVYKENAKKVKKVAFQVIDLPYFLPYIWRGILKFEQIFGAFFGTIFGISKFFFKKKAPMHDALTISSSRFKKKLFWLAKKANLRRKMPQTPKIRRYYYIEALLKDKANNNMQSQTINLQLEICNLQFVIKKH